MLDNNNRHINIFGAKSQHLLLILKLKLVALIVNELFVNVESIREVMIKIKIYKFIKSFINEL